MRYADAMIALGRGDLGAAREAVAAGLAGAPLSWDARYAWPLLWTGMRVAADEAAGFRYRREPVAAQLTRGCADLAAAAEQLATPAPPSRGYRALVAAEQARRPGRPNRRPGWRPSPPGRTPRSPIRWPTRCCGWPRRTAGRVTGKRQRRRSSGRTRSPIGSAPHLSHGRPPRWPAGPG
jgi:hypothetical protein